MREHRDLGALTALLWGHSFVNPTEIVTEIAHHSTHWSAEFVMSAARSDETLQRLVDRGATNVPVLRIARTIAQSVGPATIAGLRAHTRGSTIATLRHLRFLMLVLDHPSLGRDTELRGILEPCALREDTLGSVLVDVSPSTRQSLSAREPARTHAGHFRSLVERQLANRHSVLEQLQQSPHCAPLHESALRDICAVLGSSLIGERHAVSLADAVVQVQVRRGDYDESARLSGPLERSTTGRTGSVLLEQSRFASACGALADHWLLVFTLLSRFDLESDEALGLLGHCWRIDPETLLDEFELRGVLVLGRRVWCRLVEQALACADDRSLELVARLVNRYPDRMPTAERVHAIAASLFTHESAARRASGLRMLEWVASGAVTTVQSL